MRVMVVAAWVVVMVAVCSALELLPTAVVPSPQRTQAPAEVVRAQYVQTLYKATDYSTVMNTLIPLWPTFSTEYQDMPITTVMNQTIETSSAEFSTVLNTTITYLSPIMASNSREAAITSYDTLDFPHQTVLFTDRNNITHTDIVENDLPFV
ncbi:hypothetical protein GWK47_000580 [Chionoecetes opilio]|uniref:Uncharacterized protein n=1 Tax=Chionoecetes opilio TaxID=41210 RepID=A0A8J4Y888_CHIOP|nr:hypothetical protein GWK47_000580 [Chionoecetes opilio]